MAGARPGGALADNPLGRTSPHPLGQWLRSIGVPLSLALLFSAVTGTVLVVPDLISPAAPPAMEPPPVPAAQIDQAIRRAMTEFPQAIIRDVRFPAADRIDINFRATRHNSQAIDIVSVRISDAALVKRLPAEDNPVLARAAAKAKEALMPVLYHGDEARGGAWQEAVTCALPQVRFSCWPDVESLSEIRHVIAWSLPDELIAALPNLERGSGRRSA